MTPEAWRANVAGYLDAAGSLIGTVDATVKAGMEMKDEKGRPLVHAPQALFDQMNEARRILAQCSEWVISPFNRTKDEVSG